METLTVTKGTETTILAALALAASQYYDPSPCYAAIRELRPEVDWSEWQASVEQYRQGR